MAKWRLEEVGVEGRCIWKSQNFDL